MQTNIVTIILVALILSFVLQIYLFYLGCKNQCVLKYETLQKCLIVNRVISIILGAMWIKLAYGSWFHGIMTYNIIAVVLLLVGQALNYYMYYKLGKENIYYGKEYKVHGISNEYFTGFPFNMSHPQYIGCILSIIGIFFLTGFNNNNSIRKGALYLTLLIIGFYIMAMAIEENCYPRDCNKDQFLWF